MATFINKIASAVQGPIGDAIVQAIEDGWDEADIRETLHKIIEDELEAP